MERKTYRYVQYDDKIRVHHATLTEEKIVIGPEVDKEHPNYEQLKQMQQELKGTSVVQME